MVIGHTYPLLALSVPVDSGTQEITLTQELAELIAKTFIARGDVKAVQRADGEYMPDRRTKDGPFVPITVSDIADHLEKRKTYGHYLLNTKSRCKFFCFDIDLAETGVIPSQPAPPLETASDNDLAAWEKTFAERNPREAWRIRNDPARQWLKMQFRSIGHVLAEAVHNQMGIPVAVAYSGNKGIHVYGLTGPIPAKDARDGAQIALDLVGGFSPVEKRAGTHSSERWGHLSVEVYPKQDELSSGGLGNLLRLPLGVNTKAPKDPTFFVDMTAPFNELTPVDPIWALTDGAQNLWKKMGE